jgi:cellobiose phosphorylase
MTVTLTSRSGLRFETNANGSVHRFDCDDITLSLFLGNEIEGGLANVYLRRHSGTVEWTPLLGPSSPTRFEAHGDTGRLTGFGSWLGIDYAIALVLAQSARAWFWHVQLLNTNSSEQQLDLTYAQDLALAPYGAVRLNEFYVSQYVDHMPLTHSARGVMIASRQNQAAGGGNPWSLIGSLREGVSYCTDSMQFHGRAARSGEAPPGLAGNLPGRRLQHEHSMVVVRDAPMRLAPNERAAGGFFGLYVANHHDATSTADLERVSEVLALSEASAPDLAPGAARAANGARPLAAGTPVDARTPGAQRVSDAATLFSSAPLLEVRNPDDGSLRAFFGSQWRHEERGEQGERLSFFHGADRHVVLRAKELRVQRPHGHLLRTGRHTTPDETALTSTVWMDGVFHSFLTQGHVSINRFLSTVHTYLSLFRSHGQRVFMQAGNEWRLLGVPSAFEMSPSACRWIYEHDGGVVQVRAEARDEPQEFTLSIEVSTGAPARFLISSHIALNGDDGSAPGDALWRRDGDVIVVSAAADGDVGRRFPKGSFQIAPLPGSKFEKVGGDELLFLDGRSRQQPFFCIVTEPAKVVGLSIRGHLLSESTPSPLRVNADETLIPTLSMNAAAASSLAEPVARLADIVPWYTHNAFVHYLSPRGLEQYSGGGWGTRDVCQGPVEMLLALGRVQPIRDLLLRVLSTQNTDGDWPQWFMFFDRERDIRAGDSHGDIVFWPVLALAQYLIAAGDAGLLDERVPFFTPRGAEPGAPATVWQHIERALSVIEKRVIPNTALAAYGHGDWNDSLQPADPMMRDHLCSAWTVTLHYQTLTTLARALRAIGRANDAEGLEARAQAVQKDFQRLLLVDGVLTGYALFEDGGRIRYLLHPSDTTTGARYSALAIIHAILEDLLTPEQTREHLRLIDAHLSGPDGIRLFDRPMPYHGGPQKLFQRAESATFFGREIGLMYMHAHLRYAQALAHIGEADRFFRALCQANPIGIRSIVPSATLRQANCYYSSSDAAFADRYEASSDYERVRNGTVDLDGGWRVYSSGAGIALGLIIRRFLGLDVEADALSVDPVMPAALDGLRVNTALLGHPLEVTYRIGRAGCGVSAITLNGAALPFTSQANPHRRGAAVVPMAAVKERLAAGRGALTIELG